MRRLATALLAITLLVGGCTDGEESSTGNERGDEPATTTARPVAVHESTDADTPYFDTILEPDTLEWRPLPPEWASDSPSFIHAVDATTGAETWRLEVPYPAVPLLQLAGDRIIYSFENPGEEDFVAAIGLDGVPLWQATTNWRFHGPFYTDDDVLVGVAESRDRSVAAQYAVVALDIDDGAQLWYARLPWRPEVDRKGRLTGGSGAVYLARRNARVTAFDIASGTRRWTTKLFGGTRGTPFHADGMVYVGTSTALVALDALDGRELWAADTGRRLIASPVGVSAGNVISWMADRGRGFHVASADLMTGGPAWINDSLQRFEVGEDVVVGFQRDPSQNSPWVHVWDGADGRTIAGVDVAGNINPFSVTIEGSGVYIGTHELDPDPGRLVAIDLTTGDVTWDTAVHGSAGESIADGTAVYVPGNVPDGPQRGALHAVDRVSGEILWTLETAMNIQTRPLLESGLVFVVSAEQRSRQR